MAEKNIKTRIIHKHDTETNWEKATNFIPKQGEMIVYDIDSTHNYERVKVGDGKTLVSALPFVNEENKITVDSSLSSTSTNPVQNKVVNSAIAGKADASTGVYTVTASSTDGITYTATVSNITQLTTGVSFIMIPGMTSASTTPTININNLGEKPIRRKLSNIYTSVQNGYANNWLYVGVPFRLIYDGRAKVGAVTGCWIVEGCNKPSASDLSGSVTDAKNATNDGAGQAIADTYIKGLSIDDSNITYTLGNGNTGTVSLDTLIQSLLPKVTNITLSANAWVGSAAPYYQDITSSYVTQSCKVDIQPTAEQLTEWQSNGFTFNTLSLDGSLRIYVSDTKPTTDYSVQITIQKTVTV